MTATIAVLGAGAINGAVADDLARTQSGTLLVADRDLDRATAVADRVGGTAVAVDVTRPEELAAFLGRADVVANGIGPFYRFGRTVIDAAVEAGVHYVDVCDEYDVAAQVLHDEALDARARDVTVLTGCGASPGLTTVAGRWAAEVLDEVDALDLYIGVPTMPTFGVTINEHMLHSLSGDVLQVLDGRPRSVPAWSGTERQELPGGLGAHDFGYLGDPEPLAWKHSMPHLDRATVRWSWLEPATNDLWRAFAASGMASPEEVPGTGQSPRAFLARLLDSEQGTRIPGALPTSRPSGSAWRVVATGRRGGAAARAVADHTITYADLRCTAETLTAFPAAEGVRRILAGAVRPGVVGPDLALDPEFVARYQERTGTRLERRVEAG